MKSGLTKINRQPSKFASQKAKKKRLRLHHLNETEHFIRPLVWIVRFIFEHYVLRLKIFTPKLVDLKAALVYIKVDIALFKIGGTGFPYLGFGMQSLNRLPRAVANAFAMCLG